jgi:hypothetical protein
MKTINKIKSDIKAKDQELGLKHQQGLRTTIYILSLLALYVLVWGIIKLNQ